MAFLKSWMLGFGVMAALFAGVVMVHRPFSCWLILLGVNYCLESYISSATGSGLYWGILLLFLAACWMEHRREPRQIELIDGSLWWGIGALLLWSLVSTLGSLDPLSSFKQIGRYLLSFAFLFTLLNWMRSKERIYQTLGWMLGIAFFLGGLCALDLLAGILYGSGIHPQAASSSGRSYHVIGAHLPSPVEWGVYFAAMIPISASLLSVCDKTTKRMRWMGLCLLGIGLFWTQARSTFLAAWMGLLFLSWKMSRRWFTRMLLTTLVGAGGLLVLLQFRYGNIFAGLVDNLSGRTLLWKAALKAISENPLFGIGPGCWDLWFRRHYVSADFLMFDRQGNSFALVPTHLGGQAHNLFLTRAAEMGLPILGLLAFCIITWYRTAQQSIRNIAPGWWKALSIGCVASLVGLLFTCLFESGPILGEARGSEVILIWWLAALPFVIRNAVRSDA